MKLSEDEVQEAVALARRVLLNPGAAIEQMSVMQVMNLLLRVSAAACTLAPLEMAVPTKPVTVSSH